MMKYGAIMTSRGVAKMANAAANGQKLNVTQIAVGDGGGVTPVPDPEQTKLVNQVRIGPLNMLNVDPDNASQIIAEQVIPEDDGGYFIREIGLFDDEGELIAVANCPVTEKPVYKQGSGRTLTVRMVLMVSSTSAVTLKIDPSVVLATRQYVDNAVIEVRSQLTSHIEDKNPHPQYLQAVNALSEIAQLGDDAISAALKNLRLGEGAKMPASTGNTAVSGWMKIPILGGSDVIIQWGTAWGRSEYEVEFPVAFPGGVLHLNALINTTEIAGASASSIVNGYVKSRSNAYFLCARCENGNMLLYSRMIYWFAIGY